MGVAAGVTFAEPEGICFRRDSHTRAGGYTAAPRGESRVRAGRRFERRAYKPRLHKRKDLVRLFGGLFDQATSTNRLWKQ